MWAGGRHPTEDSTRVFWSRSRASVPFATVGDSSWRPVSRGDGQFDYYGNLMYAVIRVGTSQERVTEGQVVRVDLRSEEIGANVQFEPVLLVDGDKVTAGPDRKSTRLNSSHL